MKVSLLREGADKDKRDRSCHSAGLEWYRREFLEGIEVQGYSKHMRRFYAVAVGWFCEEAQRRKLGRQRFSRDVADEMVRVVLRQVGDGRRSGIGAGYRLERFVAYLVEAGVVLTPRPSKVVKPTVMERFYTEYVGYLRQLRGLSEATIENGVRYAERFLEFRFGDGVPDFQAIASDDIMSFIRSLMPGGRPFRSNTVTTHLRSLFKFLFWSGKTKCNLALCIPRAAEPVRSVLPRHLTPDQTQVLLDAARSDSSMGRRDYAILLLMIRLGLRAPEVVAIQLEDIDWRAGEIVIRGKGKFYDRMPLPAEVGEAVVDYIQNDRQGASRSLFLADRAPHQPFKDAQIVNYILQRVYKKTGLGPPQKRIGSHVLRHSLGMAMLASGASLEEIGHVLRHRSRVTTAIYARCDLASLRSVARQWPAQGGAL